MSKQPKPKLKTKAQKESDEQEMIAAFREHSKVICTVVENLYECNDCWVGDLTKLSALRDAIERSEQTHTHPEPWELEWRDKRKCTREAHYKEDTL